ncbi:MAG: SRPBCC domain-containing protein [Gemmatimonadales bacterium]
MTATRSSGAPSGASTTSGRELTIVRTFDAPPELVYRAWTEPEHLSRWSAPHGFTITHCEGDARPGGTWRCCMRAPEGADLWVGGVYREVVRNERLVFSHAWEGDDGRPGHETLVTVTLKPSGTGTEMTFQQGVFDSRESRDGHQGGWTQCFERLVERLGEVSRA